MFFYAFKNAAMKSCPHPQTMLLGRCREVRHTTIHRPRGVATGWFATARRDCRRDLFVSIH